jgi:hypothetical protein
MVLQHNNDTYQTTCIDSGLQQEIIERSKRLAIAPMLRDAGAAGQRLKQAIAQQPKGKSGFAFVQDRQRYCIKYGEIMSIRAWSWSIFG